MSDHSRARVAEERAGADRAEVARRALEDVCSGKRLADLPDVYHPEFVDHVNALTYRGHEGARRSIAVYQELFDDLRFVVEDQVTEGDRVASRWRLYGTHRGRDVTLRGIVISRFEGDRIVEDWATSDTLAILRQLGIWRSLLLLFTHRRLLR
jgi:predicted ester cyclase